MLGADFKSVGPLAGQRFDSSLQAAAFLPSVSCSVLAHDLVSKTPKHMLLAQ